MGVTTKGANDFDKAHTWVKPYRLFPISPTQFKAGSNALLGSQQMIQESNPMCALVCFVPENHKKAFTDCFLPVELVCVRKPRKGAFCSDISSCFLFETYHLLGWYGRRY